MIKQSITFIMIALLLGINSRVAGDILQAEFGYVSVLIGNSIRETYFPTQTNTLTGFVYFKPLSSFFKR